MPVKPRKSKRQGMDLKKSERQIAEYLLFTTRRKNRIKIYPSPDYLYDNFNLFTQR